MKKIRVYLDNCCFNRPYDDQLQPIIKIETESKLYIQSEILEGNIDLVWSFILHYENNDNPYADKKQQISLWEQKSICVVTYQKSIQQRAKEFMDKGIRTKDALHLACAIHAEAQYFITTDKKLLNKSVQGIVIINPIDFLRREHGEV